MQRTVFTVILGLGLAGFFALAMGGMRAEPRDEAPPTATRGHGAHPCRAIPDGQRGRGRER